MPESVTVPLGPDVAVTPRGKNVTAVTVGVGTPVALRVVEKLRNQYATPLLASDENDGAFGADTENDWEVAASEYWALPTCVAVTVQVPDPTKLTTPDVVTVHTDGLDELNVTARCEVAVALAEYVGPPT